MWAAGCKRELDGKLGSSGKTPVRTLSARIYVDLKNNPESIFTQVSKRPAKFYLKEKDFTSDLEEMQETDGSRETGRFHERDLHILLSSFVCVDEHFKCIKKTIYHEVSKREKSGKNRWLHPDIVGVHFPFDSYTDNTLKPVSYTHLSMVRMWLRWQHTTPRLWTWNQARRLRSEGIAKAQAAMWI